MAKRKPAKKTLSTKKVIISANVARRKSKSSLPSSLMTPKEIELIKKAIKVSKASIAVELGSFEGGTSVVISRSLNKSAKLYCVDCFVLNQADSRPRFINNVLPNFKNMKLMEMTTHNASMVFTEPIDFLLIDACHQEHAVREDLEDWLPKVKSGGLVAFHDYGNSDFPCIAKITDEMTVGWKVFGVTDTLIVKIKL